MVNKILLATICVFIFGIIKAQNIADTSSPMRQDTLKGTITAERQWWDVLRYDLTVKPDFFNKTICGKNNIQYKIVQKKHTDLMQIDLQSPLHIDSVILNKRHLSFTQEGNAWFVKIPQQSNTNIQTISIYYSGKPKESVHAPWDGGLIWSKDSLGRPWIAVACQLIGASVWYPCKVHLSDKPDKGASITIIVPNTLVAVSNGRLINIHEYSKGFSSYTWAVVNPINNYGITFYIGNYVKISGKFHGEKGKLDMNFWVLDYNQQKAKDYLVAEVFKTIKSFEYWFGPYPFYEDGFKMVESPYIGMEHQSAIGYGNQFKHGRFGAKRLTYWDMKTDRMVVHESAHEWFGNNITVKDPADRWVQEGFAGYAEELVMTDFYGAKAGNEFFLARSTNRISNDKPVISSYGIFKDGGDDMYMKGWVLIHVIRSIMNNDAKFRNMLRGMNRVFYHQTVTSAQIEAYMIKTSGIDLRHLFDLYLRSTKIPKFDRSDLK